MTEERGKSGRQRRNRRPKDRHFMDAALDAYIRGQALLLWRDVVVYRERQGRGMREALREAGFFGDRGGYAPIWSRCWEAQVLPAAELSDGEVFGRIEAAVRTAVLEEKAARTTAGAEALEDTEDYNAFLRHTLNQLLTESGADEEP